MKLYFLMLAIKRKNLFYFIQTVIVGIGLIVITDIDR